MTCTKPWKSYEEQLDQLVGRGMLVTDRVRALDHLERIGYSFAFRERSGLLVLLGEGRRKPKKVKVQRIATDQFKTGTTFQNAVDLYIFDKQLRLLLWMRWSVSK